MSIQSYDTLKNKMIKKRSCTLATILLDLYPKDIKTKYVKGCDFSTHSKYHDSFESYKISKNSANIYMLCVHAGEKCTSG
jgi:hypothetical protein